MPTSMPGLWGKLINRDGSFQAGIAPFSTLTEEFLITTHIGEWLWPGYPSHGDSNEIPRYRLAQLGLSTGAPQCPRQGRSVGRELFHLWR